MSGGRPTLYSRELLEKAEAYVAGDYDCIYKHGIPSHLGICEALRISKTTLYEWASDEGKKEFSDILAQCLAIQHNLLIGKGLSGDFNAAITKLVLGKHGYHEKVDQAVTGADGGPVKTDMTWTIKVVG